ncbi:MAG TPA: autotransporter-associated beta strand repeat-containing protein [Verrucomicrobiae bacterium]|nr:autotransporter-associated beta strand repeat-containing protein [Verrucomicrobiae bacterium]
MITREFGLRTSKASKYAVRAVAAIAIGVSLACITPARAQTFWSSTNTVDDFWSDVAAWSNDLATAAAPTAGGSAGYTISIDGAGASAINFTNDLGTAANNGFLLNQLIFSPTAGACTILGSNLIFTANGAVLPQVVDYSANIGTISSDGVILNTNTTFTGTSTSTLTITSVVSGVGGLTMNGTYTLILRASTNTYAGDTVINSGTLQAGIQGPTTDALPFGPGKGNVIVNSAATLVINNATLTDVNGLSGSGTIVKTGANNTRSLVVGNNNASSVFSGSIQNTGGTLSLSKVGSGVLTLSGTNSFGGVTGLATIFSGQVVVASSYALSNASVCTSNNFSGVVFSNITSAYFGGLGPNGNPGTSIGGIGLTNTAGQPVALYVGSNRGTFSTFAGLLNGSGSLVLNYPTYTLRVQGTNATYTGDTIVNAGTLDLNFGGWFPNGAGAGNLVVGASGIVGLRTPANGGVYNINGLSGSGTIEGLNRAGTKSLNVGNNNGGGIFTGTIQDTDPSTTNGPVALTKLGTGTLTLTGTNGYSQGTTISAGVLAVSGDGNIWSSGSINIGTGAMLDVSGQNAGNYTIGVSNQVLRGFGSIKGNVTLGSLGEIAPGTNAAPGSLTFSNNLTVTSASSLTFHAGAATDEAIVGGNLALDGSLNVLDGGGITNQTYTLFTYAGTLTTNGTPGILTVASAPNTPTFTYSISIATPHQVNLVVGCASCVPADPYTTWQQHYFPGDGASSLGTANPAGDGMLNTNKFMAGFNPTNSPSVYLHVISIAKQSTNVVVTYLGASGDSSWSPGIASRTNVLEFTTGTTNGSYSNNFASTGQTNILSGGTGFGQVTSFIDTNGANSGATRYYRVRVLLP